MTTHYVIVSIKLCRDVLKDVYVSVSYFGGLFMNSFEATEGAYEAPSPPHTPVAGSNRKAWSAYG